MKFVVKHIGTYVEKDLYFEAESRGCVIRYLLKNNNNIYHYMKLLFTKNKYGHFDCLVPVNDVYDDDDEKLIDYFHEPWYKYVNISMGVLYKCWKACTRDKILTKTELNEKMLTLLDDQSVTNIFTYFNTNGEGDQWGNIRFMRGILCLLKNMKNRNL